MTSNSDFTDKPGGLKVGDSLPSNSDELRKQVVKCFTDTQMTHDPELTLFDTDQTIENLMQLITANYTPNSEVEKQVPEAIGGHVRETYYNYDCPNNLHLFALLGDTETCVYCYVKDNPPTKGATK